MKITPKLYEVTGKGKSAKTILYSKIGLAVIGLGICVLFVIIFAENKTLYLFLCCCGCILFLPIVELKPTLPIMPEIGIPND